MAAFDFIGDALRKAGNFLTGSFSVVTGAFGDFFGRWLGLPWFLSDLIIFPIFGWRPKKQLNLKFFILTDIDGSILTAQDNIAATFELTKEILDAQADVEVNQTGILLVGGAPEGAINVTTPISSFVQLFYSDVGAFFNGLANIGIFTRTLSVIIVKSMAEDDGRSFGPAANFVLIERMHFEGANSPNNTLAHEIGHACGLPPRHRKQKINLMHAYLDGRGNELSTVQAAILRGSKFVWFF